MMPVLVPTATRNSNYIEVHMVKEFNKEAVEGTTSLNLRRL
jgi:hypothetical protein